MVRLTEIAKRGVASFLHHSLICMLCRHYPWTYTSGWGLTLIPLEFPIPLAFKGLQIVCAPRDAYYIRLNAHFTWNQLFSVLTSYLSGASCPLQATWGET